jgi:hypothetical protein
VCPPLKPRKLTKSQAVSTNNIVIETAEAHGVWSYIFVPCIVYGEGEGFGNRISIQTTAVIQAAKSVGAVYNVNSGDAVCILHHCREFYEPWNFTDNCRLGLSVTFVITQQCMSSS